VHGSDNPQLEGRYESWNALTGSNVPSCCCWLLLVVVVVVVFVVVVIVVVVVVGDY